MADKTTYQIELERRANDLIRVFNPTDKDYLVEWDRKSGTKLFRVPSKGEAVLIRYIAEKYIREMFDRLMNEKAATAVITENQKRITKGMEAMTPWKEQFKFESKFYHPTDEEVKQLLSLLYVGIESEFGIDRIYESGTPVDETKSAFERSLAALETEKGVRPAKPINNVQVPVSPTVGDLQVFKCGVCGFEAKSHIALMAHNKTHRAENLASLEDKKTMAVEGVAK